MQVALFGGLVLLIFLLMGKSSSAEEIEAPLPPPLPPKPPVPQPPRPQGGSPAAPSVTPQASYPPASPGGQGVGITPEVVERIRLMVSDAFNRAMAKRKERLAAAGKNEPTQATINATAAFFKGQGIYLEKPDPRNPPAFYRLGERAAAEKLAQTINLFMPVPLATGKTTPGTVPSATKQPSVTTTPDPAKVKVVREGYARAIAYAIDAAKQRAGKTLTPENALVPISQYFAGYGIPHPNALNAANLFWANDLKVITSKVNQAVRYAEQQVDVLVPARAVNV